MLSEILKEISHNRELKKIPLSDFPIITKAKWKNFCDSPVNLMIDDLTNAWYDSDRTGQLNRGEDWGAKLGEYNSAIWFLENNLLNKYPHAAITFFAVMGKMNSFSPEHSFVNADVFDASESFKEYFRNIIKRYKIEIAYHGYNHGCINSEGNFVQEWQGFADIESACAQIRKGQAIYKNVFGFPAQGGKYGGYDYNNFADQSIDKSDFLWWCRNWTPRSISQKVHKSLYEPNFFGENMVVNIPSTVHGRKWTKKQIDILLANQQVITIQEHIAKYRPHTIGIQKPNIIDDINRLTKLYQFLQNKNVWHATLTDIAKYYDTYKFSQFSTIDKNTFYVDYNSTKLKNPYLTIKINCAGICSSKNPYIRIKTATQIANKINYLCFDKERYQHIINLPIHTGFYQIVSSAIKN